jgi:hypothetical protein
MTTVHEEFDLQETPKATAEESRAAFPGVAAAVDEARSIFGDGVKVIAFTENGHRHEAKQYKPVDEYGGCLSPSEFIRLGEIGRENTAMLNKREAGHGRK